MQPIKWQTDINYFRIWQNGVNIHSCKYNHLKLVLEVWVLDFFPLTLTEQIQQVREMVDANSWLKTCK